MRIVVTKLAQAVLVLLWLLPAPSQAAVAFVAGSVGNDQTSTQTIECSPPSYSTGDLLLWWGYANNDVTITFNETGFTKDQEIQFNAASDGVVANSYKIASAGEPSTFTMDISGGVDQVLGCIMASFSGVDSTTPLDVTSTTAQFDNDDSPDAPDITTANNDGMVVTAIGAMQSTSGDKVGPSGFTYTAEEASTNYHIEAAHKTKATAGLETIGDWTSVGTNADSGLITVALRAAGAGGGIPPITVNQARRRGQ